MYKFLSKYLLVFYIGILLFVVTFSLVSCSKSVSPSGEKIKLVAPDVGKVNEPINIYVEPLEPGISKLVLTIDSTDTKISQYIKNYPYRYIWYPKRPGIYNLVSQAFSLIDGSNISKEKRITIYDINPPTIEDVKIIPERPYEGDEVLLQVKIGSENPIVELSTQGVVLGSSVENVFNIKSGYNYLRLGKLNSTGNVELFLKTKAYDTQDATTLKLTINPIDRVSPEIVVFADTFYAPDQNITIRVTLRDNVELARYKLTFDDQIIVDRSINGRQYTEEVFIGPRQTGTHSINVVAYDKEGNIQTFAKRVYVGGTALRFKVELSPSELVAGRTAVIAMIPEEKDVSYKRVVYLVDGQKIAEYPNENINVPQLFTLWTIEEGEHYITIYAESNDGRAGIAETNISVRDYNGPRFVSLYANEVELSKEASGRIIPGITTFKLTVYDPGGISLTTKPRLLIKEDEFSFYYRDIEMEVFEVSPDLRTVTFSAQTFMSVGYYYITVMNVADKSGNLMRDIGLFLLYVQ